MSDTVPAQFIELDDLVASGDHPDVHNIEFTEFPAVLDSSMLATARSCAQKWAYENVQNLRPQNPNVHFHTGKALAGGLRCARASYYTGRHTARDAEALGFAELIRLWGEFSHETDDKNCQSAMDAYAHYLSRWPLDEDEFRLSPEMHEYSVAVPMNVLHPVTAEPLIYGGRFDTYGSIAGLQMICDEKTTGRFDAKWDRKWPLRAQFLGYTWLARHVAKLECAGVLCRGILVNGSQLAALECYCFYSDWQLDNWWQQINDEAALLVEQWRRRYFHSAYGGSPCIEYNGCPYWELCQVPPEQRAALYNNFRREAWHPLGNGDNGEQPNGDS